MDHKTNRANSPVYIRDANIVNRALLICRGCNLYTFCRTTPTSSGHSRSWFLCTYTNWWRKNKATCLRPWRVLSGSKCYEMSQQGFPPGAEGEREWPRWWAKKFFIKRQQPKRVLLSPRIPEWFRSTSPSLIACTETSPQQWMPRITIVANILKKILGTRFSL